MFKKVALATLIITIIFAGWYIFFRTYHYVVTFRSVAPSTEVFYTIKKWIYTHPETYKNTKIIGSKQIETTFTKNDISYNFYWNISPLNDTLSSVKLGVIDFKEGNLNKLKILFSDTPIKSNAITSAQEVYRQVQLGTKSYRTEIVGIDTLNTPFCLCARSVSLLEKKASKMIDLNATIMDYKTDEKLKINGNPFLEVKKWDIDKKQLVFDFCFPIEKKDILPHPAKPLFFKQKRASVALKGIYYGNYKTSDVCWERLLNYAKKNNIETDNLPTEIFRNNPHEGGDELKWKADVFVPLTEQPL